MTSGSKAASMPAGTAGDGGGAGRVLVPIIAGTVLFALHMILIFGAGAAGQRWRAAGWGTGLVGLVLLVYGAVALSRRLGAEERQRRSMTVTRAQLQALIDASPLAITAADVEGRVILWSAAAEEIFGWAAEEAVGRVDPAVPEAQAEDWRRLHRRVLDGETIHGVKTRSVTRTGRLVDVNISAAPILDDHGAVTGTVTLVEDLSASPDAALEVANLETQLRQAQKLEVVGRLAAGIAHDFNNFLTAIRGNAELMLSADIVHPDLENDLREISRSADRAGALTRQLLTFAHQGPVESRPMDVNRLVQGMEGLIQRLIGETIELRVEPSVDAGAVLTDPNQIEQVLMNLVVNARDALPDGGRITVRTRAVEVGPEEAESLPYEVRPGPFATISVIDDGAGMDPETAGRIFEPFFTTKPAGVGTGLGLSTVYSIIKQARGHIRVETEVGSGTAFRVYLPRAEAEQERTTQKSRGAVTHDGGTETILVAEDEEAVLSMAQRALERHGYEVLPTLSGREALGIALKHPGEIDILFCDMVMPDLTGREVAERIKAARPGIEVLMTSGYGERQLAGDEVLGDMAFLPKPYTPEQLETRIRELLGAPTPD